jgi:hypothetical protein
MANKSFISIVEALESRIAPASLIDVIVNSGNLTLKTVTGSDGAESLNIINGANANEYVLDPSPGTKLRVNGVELADGEDFSVQDITGSISVSLGAGDDRLEAGNTRFGAGLKIDMGDGTNYVSLDGATASSFSFKGGANDDTVLLSKATIAGSVMMDLGAGKNSAFLGTGALIAGDLTIKGGVGTDEVFNNNSSPTPLRIGGKFTADLGDGDNYVALVGALNVGRDVSITSGKGTDSIGFNSGGDCAIGGNLTVNTGTGPDSTNLNVGGVFQVGKNLTINSAGSPGGAVLQKVRAGSDISIGGNLMFKSGRASTVTQEISSVDSDIAVAGSITFGGGSAQATQTVEAEHSLTVGKGVSLVAPGGGIQNLLSNTQDNSGNSRIIGPVSITGGTGINLMVDGDLHGPVKIQLGKTISGGAVRIGNLDPASIIRLHGPVTVDLNSQAGGVANEIKLSNATLGDSVTLLGGVGYDRFTFEDVLAMGLVKIDGGAGNDSLVVEKISALQGRSNFLGTVIFKGGTGDDQVAWGGDAGSKDEVFAAKLVTIDGGPGQDTFTAGSGATFFVPVKTLGFP